MATKTIVQNNKTPQLSSISIMFEYDIDNTLNTIKENSQLINKMKSHFVENSSNSNTNTRREQLEQHQLQQQDQQHQKHQQQQQEQQNNSEINNNNNLKKGHSATSAAAVAEILSTTTTTSTLPANLQTNARKRWKILAKVLRKNSDELSSLDEEHESDEAMETASVRRFKSFELLRQDSFSKSTEFNELTKLENWYTYKIELLNASKEYSVNIHHIDRHLTAEDLMGFNNTGNICVWPSEEALTVYALSDLESFRGKWILELGGGMTCLSALMLAKYARPYAVHLTDGNSLSVENVHRSICLNELSCYIKCSILKWEDVRNRSRLEYEKFDYILSADCLFFDDVRTALVDTIWYYLAKNGIALVMAPRRGGTLMKFVEECQMKGFSCEIIQRYNELIWQKHLEFKECPLYDDDIHYPVLIKLRKIQIEVQLLNDVD